MKRLPAGAYTAVLRSVDGTSTGVGVVQLYDLSTSDPAELGNLAARAFVQTDDNVLFGGIILAGGNAKRVVFRAIGPSIQLNGAPVPGTLQDPTLELHDSNGVLLQPNDNWKDGPDSAAIQNAASSAGARRGSSAISIGNGLPAAVKPTGGTWVESSGEGEAPSAR